MDLVLLLRYLRGYVKFSVQSGPAERLLNICAHRGVRLWDCRGTGGSFSACVSPRGYRKMRRLARKAQVRLRVRERHGLPFLCYRYRKRIGIAVGALFFALALVISQQFVWVIEVEGCKSLDEAVLRNTLTELGVRRGTLKYQINPSDVKQQMQLRFNEVAWSALNIEGTTATLLIRERTLPLAKIDTGVPANIVAAEDGQIKRMEVTDGVPVRKAGETVRAGELIVSGIYEDRWGLTHLMRANARVLAHVPKSLEVRIPLTQERCTPTGELLTRRYLEVAGLHIPLFLYSGVSGDYKLERTSTHPTVLGVEMPFAITRERYIFFEREREKITPEFALRLAERRLTTLEQTELHGAALSRTVKASEENGELVLHGEYLVETDIATQVEIPLYDRALIEKQNPPREGGY